ncbi:MAG: ATP-binding cassette domain-containing protein, partial [Bowdeniella nasicola]|nr:ATP-binding cassette domain-containing protein [Bowdeniella nasicola]
NAEVMDLLAGLATLRGFNRERGPIARVKQLASAYTRVTMQTLKVAFLSGAVLEFLTTLSVALVAVTVGMRLVYGNVGLLPALIVIMLAPEVFQPLRQVGAHFHASADGLAAADAAFALLETELPSPGTQVITAPEDGLHVRFADLSVQAPGRQVRAPANLHGSAHPGQITALTGTSGAGKTTAVMALLGLVQPSGGAVLINEDYRVQDLDTTAWHRLCTWVPQRPAVLPGTVLSQFGVQDVDAQLLTAAADTGFDTVVAHLPDGWHTQLGHGGLGLSVGQRQRLALTRALVSPSPIMIFDEPSAHLDAASEQAVLTTLKQLRDRGHTVIVVAHRASLTATADAVIAVRSRSTDEVGANA